MRRVWGGIGRILGVALCAAALGAAPARAAVGKGSWEIGGYALASRYSNNSTVEDSQSFLGARGTYHFQDRAGVEIDLDFSQTDSTDRASDTEFDVTKVGVSYVRNFESKKNEKLAPVLLFGLGRILVDDGMRESGSTLFRAGGGIRYFFSPHLGIRVDGRLFRWRGDNEAVPRDGYFSFDLTVGITYLFGGGS